MVVVQNVNVPQSHQLIEHSSHNQCFEMGSLEFQNRVLELYKFSICPFIWCVFKVFSSPLSESIFAGVQHAVLLNVFWRLSYLAFRALHYCFFNCMSYVLD